jgi:hypothetical protein
MSSIFLKIHRLPLNLLILKSIPTLISYGRISASSFILILFEVDLHQAFDRFHIIHKFDSVDRMRLSTSYSINGWTVIEVGFSCGWGNDFLTLCTLLKLGRCL